MNLREFIQSEIKSQLRESVVTEEYTGNSGDNLTHKHDKSIEIELIEPTNRGWKVYQTTNGKKRKIAYYDKQDLVGDKSLFESVNEAIDIKSDIVSLIGNMKSNGLIKSGDIDGNSSKAKGKFKATIYPTVNTSSTLKDFISELKKHYNFEGTTDAGKKVFKFNRKLYGWLVNNEGLSVDIVLMRKLPLKEVARLDPRFETELDADLNEAKKDIYEAITDGDVVIFKKQKGEVPKITYNSSRKQFAADFLSHTDYYKNLTDAIEDMQDAGFKIEKHIQTESVNEGKQYKKGDKLKIKLKNGKEFDLTFDSYGRQKGMAFGKFDGDKKPFSLDTIKEEQLDEKLITFSNRKPYGQIVFMAGGAGSGKGFAIDNFIDAAGFKVRDVDEMKSAVGKLDQLGKFSIDDWFKKYASKLPEEDRAHVEEFVVGKGMSIADVANNLKDPNNVAALHYIVDAMGLKDKWIINMLSGKTNKETLPNLLFDITAKKVNSISDVIKPLVDAGYDPKNIHLIWVLTDYHLAVSNNKGRDRVVPDDILLGTHEGAAKTIWGILTKGLPKGLNGRIDVILNNRENTVTYKDSKGNEMKGAVKGFLSLPVKKQGGGNLPEKVWKELLYKWISDNGPKTIDLSKPLDRQMRK
jgi:hypothetical protein